MKIKISVNKAYYLCGAVLLLALFSGQSLKLFGISGGVAFQFLFFSKYFAAAFLVAYTFTKKREISNYEIRRFLKIFLPLILLMVVVECIAAFESPVPKIFGLKYWTRSLFIFLDRLCIYAVIVCMWALCSDRVIDCLIATFLIDQFLIFISALFHVGLSGVVDSFLGAFSFRDGTSNYFEVHELTFSLGLCIIYCLFFEMSKKRKIGRLVLLISCFIIGAKRIGLLGIVVAGIFAFFVHKKGLTLRKVIVIGIAGVCICFAYLFIIYNNEFFSILNAYGINNMGRDLIYAYYTKRTELSVSQLGWGIAGVAKVVENMDRGEVLYMAAVRGLHNDILKIYINFGFWGALIWYAINLIYIPAKFFEKYGKRTATIYISLVLYMFITYLTDNTEAYFVCQVVVLLIPIADYWIEKRKKCR